jgi:N-acetylneuraminic acid mutarotase
MVCDILFCFNTKTQQWERPEVSGNLPGARDGHSACIVGHKMYIFGGFEEMMDQFSCDVHCFDLKTMQWSFVYTSNSPPSFRDFHTASVINNNRMYIFGGRGDIHAPYHSQNEIYCPKSVYLDLDTCKWIEPDTVTGEVPTGRRSHSAFVYKNLIYIFGGYNGLLDLHFNDLHCFDPSTNVWSLVKTQGTSPKARRRQSCIVIDTKMYLFGGTCPISNNSTNMNAAMGSQQLIDYNDTHVLDFQPSLKTLCIFTVVQNSLNLSELPQDIIYEIRMMQQANSISRPLTNTG